MTKEYIERESAKYAVDDAIEMYPSEYDAVCENIDKIPTADVAPVVRGRWIKKPYNVVCVNLVGYVCDQCGREEQNPEPYCHCGAKMNMEVQEDAKIH